MEFYFSRPRILLVQTCLIILAAGVIFLITQSSDLRDGLIEVVLPIPILIVIFLVPSLMDSKPQIVFDSAGIQCRRRHWSEMAWDDILTIHVRNRFLFRDMLIELKDPSAYRERLKQANVKGADNIPFELSFGLLRPSIKDAITFLESHHPDKLTKPVA